MCNTFVVSMVILTDGADETDAVVGENARSGDDDDDELDHGDHLNPEQTAGRRKIESVLPLPEPVADAGGEQKRARHFVVVLR